MFFIFCSLTLSARRAHSVKLHLRLVRPAQQQLVLGLLEQNQPRDLGLLPPALLQVHSYLTVAICYIQNLEINTNFGDVVFGIFHRKYFQHLK